MGFGEIWVVDFEYPTDANGRPKPVCMVARARGTGRVIKRWGRDVRERFPASILSSNSLFVSYAHTAEGTSLLACGLALPPHVLDVRVEAQAAINGLPPPRGQSWNLITHCCHFGVPAMDTERKKEIRDLIIAGRAEEHRSEVLGYCLEDVIATDRILSVLVSRGCFDTPQRLRRALLRGQYLNAVSLMEHHGIPLDVETFHQVRDNLEALRLHVVSDLAGEYGVYEGDSFRAGLFADLLRRHGRLDSWPRLDRGRLCLKGETFKQQGQLDPVIERIRIVRDHISALRELKIPLGADGRVRVGLMPITTRTSRHAAPGSKFIFHLAAWLRSLIQPEPGTGLAYLDYEAQEFAIMAFLAGDHSMIGAYESGDPYIQTAINLGLAPPGATKKNNKRLRSLVKMLLLAVQYGMSEAGLAQALGVRRYEAKRLLRLHQRKYPLMWSWTRRTASYARLTGEVESLLGWTDHYTHERNRRQLQNFPVQSSASDVFRLGVIMTAEKGVRILAPVHDGMLIEAPLADLTEATAIARTAMEDASRILLDGFVCRVGVKSFRYPDRYKEDDDFDPIWVSTMCFLRKQLGLPTAVN